MVNLNDLSWLMHYFKKMFCYEVCIWNNTNINFVHKLAILKNQTKQKNKSCHKTEKKNKDYTTFRLHTSWLKLCLVLNLVMGIFQTNFTFFSQRSEILLLLLIIKIIKILKGDCLFFFFFLQWSFEYLMDYIHEHLLSKCLLRLIIISKPAQL